MKLGRGIYLRGNIYWLSCQINGERSYVTLQTSDPATALNRAAEVRGTLKDSTPDPTSLKAEVEKFIAECVREKRWRRQTARVHGAALREFVAERGEDARLTQITSSAARAYYITLQKRLKESGAQIRMRAIKTFFNHMVKTRRLHVSPFAAVELPEIAQLARTGFCTRAQRDALIASAAKDDIKFILYCGFFCGMRRNEIVEARAGWFDLRDGGNVHIQNTATFEIKDRDNRPVPLTKDFRTFLAVYLAGKGIGDFALKPEVKHGKGTYRYDFIRPFSAYVESQGMKWVTPHVLRKTFASLLVQAGVSIYKVARWIGDEVDTTQKHYAHLAPQDPEIEKLV